MSIELKAIDIDDVFEYLKWLLLAGILAALIGLGYKLGKNHNAEVIAKQSKAIAQQTMAIKAQATRIREINALAEQAIKAEAEAKRAAAKAGDIAERAEKRAAQQNAAFDKRIKQARKNPDCNALLSQDVRKICGL
jgi:predicted negative regulator of RcsB-dependent stress response